MKNARIELTKDGKFFRLAVSDEETEVKVELTESELDGLVDGGTEVYNGERPQLLIPLTQHGGMEQESADQILVREICEVSDGLTPWETNFVEKMSKKKRYTESERGKLREIHTAYVQSGSPTTGDSDDDE
jgi:hypothetical protein